MFYKTVMLEVKKYATDESSAEIIHVDGTIEKGQTTISDRPTIFDKLISPNEAIINDMWSWYFVDYPDSDVISRCKEF